MKWNLWAICLILPIITLSGCTQIDFQKSDSLTESGMRISNAMYITNFLASEKNNRIEIMFSLMDTNKQYTSSDGIADVRIVNSNGKTVYNGTFNIRKEDFDIYTWTPTGNDFLACKLTIPVANINKSLSSSGTAYMSYRTATGRFGELDSVLFNLPTYTEKEIVALNERAYDESKTIVNKKESNYGIELTVLSAGKFTYRPYFWGDEQTDFRIDLKIKNLMGEKQNFYPLYGAVILADENQYEANLFVSDNTGAIFPGVTVEGYLLFDNFNLTNFTLIIEDQPNYGDIFSFAIDMASETPKISGDSQNTSGSCGREGESCCPNNYCKSSYLTSLTCENGVCVECGGTNQPPCSGFECNYGEVFDNGICVTCGGKGEPCCIGDLECEYGNTCINGECVECGGNNQIPCETNACDYGYELIEGKCKPECGYGEIRVDGSCVECGDVNQPCCDGGECISYPTTTCIDGTCEYCGRKGEICCEGDKCNTGNKCANGKCEPCGSIGEPCCSPDNVYICLIGDCVDDVCVYNY